jgi:hypothetical protein
MRKEIFRTLIVFATNHTCKPLILTIIELHQVIRLLVFKQTSLLHYLRCLLKYIFLIFLPCIVAFEGS